MADSSPTEADVLDALSRLLAWPEIARSKQLSRFLEYIVHAALRGDGASIKAYSIAVDVFGRAADFDPQQDPIVRVQARRLRSLLSEYYAGPGEVDSVRVELPTGRYVPVFHQVLAGKTVDETVEASLPVDVVLPEKTVATEASKADSPARAEILRSWLMLAFATLCLATVAFAVANYGQEQQRQRQAQYLSAPPKITVMEFERLADEADDVSLTAGLSIELVTRLNSFGTIDASYGGPLAFVDPNEREHDYVLSGIARPQNGSVQYSAILTHARTEQVIWSGVIEPVASAEPAKRIEQAAIRLASALGSINGPLHAAARREIDSGTILVVPSIYLCRMLFSVYREVASEASQAEAQKCFAQLGPRRQVDGSVLAARGSLILEGAAGSGFERATNDERIAAAEPFFAQAISTAPLNAFVWAQTARFAQFRGAHADAEVAYATALKLNPADTDTMAARARHLVFIGQVREGSQLAETAIASSATAPNWYYVAPALVAWQRDDLVRASELASAIMEVDAEIGTVIALLVGLAQDDADAVNRYLPEILANTNFRASGILPRLGLRIKDEAVIRRIGSELAKAGVSEQVLNGPAV